MGIPQRVRLLGRPLARAVRLAGVRLGRVLRPPVPWSGDHHPALLRIPPWSGEADGRFCHDFIGVRTDPKFRGDLRPDPPGSLATDYPRPFAGYFELAFVLAAVAEARDSFTLLEVGAGYGPWSAVAHCAASRIGATRVRTIGVEMDPQHCDWMEEHLRNNGVAADDHVVIRAAVDDREGEAWFLREPDPSLRYGQRMLERAPSARGSAAVGSRGGAVRVARVRLRGLLAQRERIDLMHVDIQGAERRALPDAMAEIDRVVERLFVATHSRRIHRGLRKLLNDTGWRIGYDFRPRSRERTLFGDVYFVDGVLAAVNPRRRGGPR